MAEDKVAEVDMTEEQDKFHEVISNAISLLVRALETQCEPSLTAVRALSLFFFFFFFFRFTSPL